VKNYIFKVLGALYVNFLADLALLAAFATLLWLICPHTLHAQSHVGQLDRFAAN
jgi:hypothetical protein